MPSRHAPWRPLLAFHTRSGVRLALRANAVVLGGLVVLFGMAPEAMRTIREFLVGLIGRGHDSSATTVVAVVAVMLTRAGAPRLATDGAGWMRSLPISNADRRIAMILGLTIVGLPIFVLTVVAVPMVAIVYHRPISWLRVASMPLVVLAAATVVTVIYGAGARTSPRRGRASPGSHSALGFWLLSSWRAIGLRRIVGSTLFPIIFIGFAHLAVRNNGLTGHDRRLVVCICGALAVTTLAGALSNLLLAARPPWAWVRSLPCPARRRLVWDAAAVAVPTMVVALALAPVDAISGCTVAAMGAIASVVAAVSIRGDAERLTGAAGECMLIAGAECILVAVWPFLLPLAAASVVPLIAWGVRREHRARAARWSELHHAASGDPSWLSRA